MTKRHQEHSLPPALLSHEGVPFRVCFNIWVKRYIGFVLRLAPLFAAPGGSKTVAAECGLRIKGACRSTP